MKIMGTTITPKWDWTPDYRAYVRRQMDWRVRSGERQSWVALAEDQARKYARWLAARDGLELGEAIGAECEWHYLDGARHSIKAVTFRERRTSYYPSGRSYRAAVALIDIPHFDFVPRVTGSDMADDGAGVRITRMHGCDARGRLTETHPPANASPAELRDFGWGQYAA